MDNHIFSRDSLRVLTLKMTFFSIETGNSDVTISPQFLILQNLRIATISAIKL